MATYTPNLNLKKPSGSDYVMVSDFNSNSDVLDSIIGKPSQLETEERTNLVLAINEAVKRGGENAPYIDDDTNTWWMWDFKTYQYIDTGVKATGEIVNATATVDNTSGNPRVEVTLGGTATERTLDFVFTGIRGVDGMGSVVSVNNVRPDGEGNVTLLPEDIGFAPASKVFHLVLLADAWTDNRQILSVPGLLATDNGNADLDMDITKEEFHASTSAMLKVTAQADDEITITAFGVVPNINIPIQIIKE